jgi:putative endonuclease
MFKAAGRGGSTKSVGDAAEARALQHQQRAGQTRGCRKYRVARGPGARGGEIDLVMRAADGTLVFVEVRSRRANDHGGALASVTAAKQRSLVFAAQHYLLRVPVLPPCRFDVVAVQGDEVQWVQAAFDAA